nr:hypothetical protein [Rathayibacter tritici]
MFLFRSWPGSTVISSGSLRGAPRLWAITSWAEEDARTPSIPGSCSPLVSLTTPAPAAMLARATSARVVSTETTTSLRSAIPATTGTTRSSSFCTETAGPRPKGTPPMSTQSAPDSSARTAA